jgi:hypothetical protein
MLSFNCSDRMARITLSYRREDSMDITGRIFDRLTSRYGRETVFRDIDNIPPGRDFREHIRSSIEGSDVLMVVVGPHWLGSARHGQPRVRSETDYVRVEVEAALEKHIPVVPLLVGGADMPEPNQLPDSIREFAYRNAVQIDSGRDFDHHMNGLIRATDDLLGAKPTLASMSPAAAVPGSIGGRVSDGGSETRSATTGRAPQGSLFFPVIGGVMTVVGLMHIAWFTSNLLAALSASALPQMFQQVWTYADMSFGFGGLVIGIGTIYGARWARMSGVILCLLAAFSNFLWFVDYYDKDLPRLMVVGTGFASLLAILGAYLLLFRAPPEKG